MSFIQEFFRFFFEEPVINNFIRNLFMSNYAKLVVLSVFSLTSMLSASDFAEAAGELPAITADAPSLFPTGEEFKSSLKKNLGLTKKVVAGSVAAPVSTEVVTTAPVVVAPAPLVKNGKPMILQPGQEVGSSAEQSKAIALARKAALDAKAAGKETPVVAQEATPSRFASVKEYVKNHKAIVATGVVVTVVAAYGVYKLVTYVQAKRAEKAAILAQLKSMQVTA